MKTLQTFDSLMREFQPHHKNFTVFSDFLTLAIAALARDYKSGKSYDEDLYMETINKYKEDPLRFNFSKMFSALVDEMDDRRKLKDCPDILGEYYEANFYEKGKSQYFSPWPICTMMAKMSGIRDSEKQLHVLDGCCGTARLLMASAFELGPQHRYYGIDIDMTCVQMAAINLFLNGIWNSEVMCADMIRLDDFKGSYVISKWPLGIYRVMEKEKSELWNRHINSFGKKPEGEPVPAAPGKNNEQAPQLKLF